MWFMTYIALTPAFQLKACQCDIDTHIWLHSVIPFFSQIITSVVSSVFFIVYNFELMLFSGVLGELIIAERWLIGLLKSICLCFEFGYRRGSLDEWTESYGSMITKIVCFRPSDVFALVCWCYLYLFIIII
jgi:hypothetical protein